MKVKRNCKICGKEFFVYKSRLKYNRGITCSRRCQYISVKQKNSKPKIKLICKYCNKIFFRCASQIGKNGKGQYCSKLCAYSNKKRGELATNWKGGKVKGNEKIRKSKEYKEWIKKIIKRDSYTCRICGIQKVQFHVHHIKEFSKYPELRFTDKNAITICIPCHSAIHNKILRRIRYD